MDDSYFHVASLYDNIVAYQTRADVQFFVDQAKESRDIDEYSYRHGAASLLDFLDAERSFRATQLAYRQALATYLLAIEQLREAVGTRSLP